MLSETMKTRLRRLPAMVKGYLTRRLMKTETVMNKIATIRDTTQLLTSYRNPTNKKITTEDVNFHKRLMIQLHSSCLQLYDIFFNYSKSSQMSLIRRSREAILDRHYRTASVLSNSSYIEASFNPTLSHSSVKKVVHKRLKSKTNVLLSNTPHSKNSALK